MSNPSSMTPERWQRLQTLFDRALALEPQARAEFVVAECGDDLALREQLLSLIMASATDDDRFEDRVEGAISAMMLRNTELPPGQRIGHYRVVKLIGRGGMGAVYLAERADLEFEQRVAIKVVADGALSNRIVARLRSERQILANLNHPNIARLLDGGATSDGTPFLAMEYVDGQRLDLYCAEHRLTIADKLRLFQQVCAAVQYAHQNLVVHRDIKPSNILVAADGTPKLLDFGIAKLVDPNATTQGIALTRVHERVLTPEHASPEQVRGDRVGTVSDVYALGVLLYELLTGLKPHNFTGLSFEQIERVICDEEAPKPSEAALAASRLDVPLNDALLAKSLAGDLDTIVMKAMHKDSQQRYASAGALADDIENFLSNRPIAGRADSVGYRARKFWRRNRLMLSTAAAVVFSIFGLIAFYTWQLSIERDNAAIEAEKARQVADFLTGMFRASNPTEAQGRTITALDLLDLGAKQIESELEERPRIRADLQSVIGASYKSLGAYERARPLLESALAIKRAAGLEDTHDFLLTLHEYANLRRFLGDFDGARPLFEEVIARERKLVAGDPGKTEDLISSLANFGMLYYEKARYDEALPLAQEAFDLVRQLGVEGKGSGAEAMNNLGLVLQERKEYPRAEELLRRALDVRQRELGERHPLTLTSKSNLSLLLRTTGRYREAADLMEELLPLRREILGPDHPNVGFLLQQLGGTLTMVGSFDRAERHLEEAREIIRRRLGEGHYRYAAVVRYLGINDSARGRYRSAEEQLRKVRAIEVLNYGAEDPQPHRTDILIARTLRGQRLDRAADRLIEQTYEYFQTLKRPGKVDRGRLMLEIGRMRIAQGRWGEAEAILTRDLADWESIGGASDPANVGPLQALAQVALHKGQHDLAIAHSRRAFEIVQKQTPDLLGDLAVAKSIYGECLRAAGNEGEAKRLLEEAYAELAKLRPKDDPVVAAARDRLSRS